MDCDFDTGWRTGFDLCLVIEALVVGLPTSVMKPFFLLLACYLLCSLEVLSSVFSFFLSVVIFQRLNPNPIKMGPRLVRQ